MYVFYLFNKYSYGINFLWCNHNNMNWYWFLDYILQLFIIRLFMFVYADNFHVFSQLNKSLSTALVVTGDSMSNKMFNVYVISCPYAAFWNVSGNCNWNWNCDRANERPTNQPTKTSQPRNQVGIKMEWTKPKWDVFRVLYIFDTERDEIWKIGY